MLENNPTKFFVCGDIHGKYLEFISELDKIKDQISEEQPLILLGDYFDRSPFEEESKMMQWIIENHHRKDIIMIRGNHDEWFISHINGTMGGITRETWIAETNGGLDTMVACDELSVPNKKAIKKIFASLKPIAKSNNIIFTHAGLHFSHMLHEYITDTWGANSSYYINQIDNEYFEECTPEKSIQVIGHWIPLYCGIINKSNYTEEMRPYVRYKGRLIMCDSSVHKQRLQIHNMDFTDMVIDGKAISAIEKVCKKSLK